MMFLLITCAMPEPINPPPIIVTFFITFDKDVEVAKVLFNITNELAIFNE